jgi:hypothetical protein
MANVVEFITFNLKKGTSVADFLLASDKINSGFLAAQKGFIARKLLVKDEIWADWVLWETMEDAQNAANTAGVNFADHEYFSFIENCDMRYFSVEKNY